MNTRDNASGGFASTVKRLSNRYFITALGAMAKGLFASLLVGTILSQFAKLPFLESVISPIVSVAQNGYVVGAAIGVAIAFALDAKTLTICSSAVVGALGYMSGAGGAGPVGAYVAALIGTEFGRLVEGRTKVDILVVPVVSLLTGGIVGWFLGAPLGEFMRWLGVVIGRATFLAPIPMGITVSVLMGLILTAPISSAALAAMIFVSVDAAGAAYSPDILAGVRLAAGAATIGCSCQMVGFAVSSFRENGWGGVVSQGLGTSMLQVPNILRHPAILVPPTLASAILGPIGTAVFHMENMGIAGGMGTCGLVGQIGTFTVMLESGESWVTILALVLLMHIVAPALISLAVSEGMRKLGWIRDNDMLLD